MANRRAAVRTKIDRDVSLAAPDGSVSCVGRLCNLSARGAKIALSDHDDLPERVILYIARDGVSWPCRIVRRRESEVGVLFV